MAACGYLDGQGGDVCGVVTGEKAEVVDIISAKITEHGDRELEAAGHYR